MTLLARVKIHQNRSFANPLLQAFKCPIALLTSFEFHILLGECVEWTSYLQKILDELTIKVTEPNEQADFSNTHW